MRPCCLLYICQMNTSHNFHIPVLGIGYSIDTPIRVAHYGITSCISLGDHRLLYQLTEHYARQYNLPFYRLDKDSPEFRTTSIKNYLNLVQDIVESNLNTLKDQLIQGNKSIDQYFQLQPIASKLRQRYEDLKKASGKARTGIIQEMLTHMKPGQTQVNIMTKVDRTNSNKKNEELPVEFNDAHAAVRGFTQSNLKSTLVLSAGLNTRLFDYMAKLDEFLPNPEGSLDKQIALKVSDLRSAEVQSSMLAKKGLWISEFRVESGINCGGHAFASGGQLLGPVLSKFKATLEHITASNFNTIQQSSHAARYNPSTFKPHVRLTAQGGVGTAEEHQFLIKEYQLDSVGWGSPFLLVPEAVNIDKATLSQISKATQKDVYLSKTSPLGVPFYTLRGNTKDYEKTARILKKKPGSPCTLKHLAFDTEFGAQPLCTASSAYQKKKLDQLTKSNAPSAQIQEVLEKTCICTGLSASSRTNLGIKTKLSSSAVSICPGPNIAYFDHKMTLLEMVNHIYGLRNELSNEPRPHVFINELRLYVAHFNTQCDSSPADLRRLKKTYDSLRQGITYYLENVERFAQHNTVATIDELTSCMRTIENSFRRVEQSAG